MKRLLLIHTGGTLGMRGTRPSPLRPAEFASTLRRNVPELWRVARIDVELFANVDSSEIQPEMWSTLATILYRRLPRYDGAVVTHGTDTMAWTASALSFMLPNLRKPVVLTGAQRPLREVRSDARLNLIDAVTSAVRGPAEVTVCFDSQLYRGNRIRKVAVSEYNAFDSPNHPRLGVLGVNAEFSAGVRPRGRFQLLPKLEPRVWLVKVYPGLDPAWLLPALPALRGLVLEAHGAGNFPVSSDHGRSLKSLFLEAQRLNLPVLVVSQAHRNGVDLSMYQAGAWALKHGALSGGDMTGTAAVVKLMHALAHFGTRAGVAAYIQRAVAGERTA